MSEYQPATAHVDGLLEAFHAGMLPAAEAERVERHLRECAACRQRSAQIGVYQIIRAAPAPTVGPELRQRVYARIAAASAPSSTTERPAGRAALSDRYTRDARYASGAPQSRARLGWLSGAVAVVIVALIASVIWALPHGQGSSAGKHGQTATAPVSCPASATSATLPKQPFVINSLAMTSATDGWAVGAVNNDQGFAAQGLIMRFSQCHWAPISTDLPGISLSAISMDSATDGWAGGAAVDGSKPVLLHYSDGVWSKVGAPQFTETHGAISKIAMSAPDDGWLVTMGPGLIQQANVSAYAQTLFHDARGTWAPLASPLPMIDAIAPVGPDDVWIAGTAFVGSGKTTTHSFAHYQNGHWTVEAEPAGLWASSLSAVSPTDIWASGTDMQGHPVAAHYNGATWLDAPEALPTGASYTPEVVTVLGDGAGWATIFHTATSTPGAAPGARLLIADVLRETGGHWQQLGGYTDINRITTWASFSDGEVWATGIYQTYEPPTPLPGGGSTGVIMTHTVLLHYAAGVWSRYGG